jgi:hypothetical protein
MFSIRTINNLINGESSMEVIEVVYPWTTETGTGSVYYGSIDDARVDAKNRYRTRQMEERSNPVPMFECERPARVSRCFVLPLKPRMFADMLNSRGGRWCSDIVELGIFRFRPDRSEIDYCNKRH